MGCELGLIDGLILVLICGDQAVALLVVCLKSLPSTKRGSVMHCNKLGGDPEFRSTYLSNKVCHIPCMISESQYVSRKNW